MTEYLIDVSRLNVIQPDQFKGLDAAVLALANQDGDAATLSPKDVNMAHEQDGLQSIKRAASESKYCYFAPDDRCSVGQAQLATRMGVFKGIEKYVAERVKADGNRQQRDKAEQAICSGLIEHGRAKMEGDHCTRVAGPHVSTYGLFGFGLTAEIPFANAEATSGGLAVNAVIGKTFERESQDGGGFIGVYNRDTVTGGQNETGKSFFTDGSVILGLAGGYQDPFWNVMASFGLDVLSLDDTSTMEVGLSFMSYLTSAQASLITGLRLNTPLLGGRVGVTLTPDGFEAVNLSILFSWGGVLDL